MSKDTLLIDLTGWLINRQAGLNQMNQCSRVVKMRANHQKKMILYRAAVFLVDYGHQRTFSLETSQFPPGGRLQYRSF